MLAFPSTPPALRLALVLALGALAGPVMGCRGGSSDGYNGDQPPPPVGKSLGDGTPISSKLYGTCVAGVCAGNGTSACNADTDCPGFYGPAPWYQPSNMNSLGCDYPPTLTEHVTGATVTAVDTWDEDGNGSVGTIYIQDTIGLTDASQIPPYAGTSIFGPSFSPPDLRVEPGNVLDVSGAYEEFVGPSADFFSQCSTLPQMTGSVAFRFDGTVPPPVEIKPTDISNEVGARSYLNMLVKVDNVTIAAAGKDSSGRYSANVLVDGNQWAIDDELWDVYHLCPLAEGQTFKSVTGIVTYFFSYHVAPRSGADFDPPCGPMPDGG